jgi:putative Holliday junction resolvase
MTSHSVEARAGVLQLEDFRQSLPLGTRLIGIDVGTKTLGLALSDVNRIIASSLVTLRRRKLALDLQELVAVTNAHGAGGFVIGLPLNMNGSAGPRAQATRAFARDLAKAVPFPILLWDERLSTTAAERTLLEADTSRRRRAQLIDKVAAVWILQGALDRMTSP